SRRRAPNRGEASGITSCSVPAWRATDTDSRCKDGSPPSILVAFQVSGRGLRGEGTPGSAPGAEAAVDDHGGAVDVGGVRGAQEGDHGGDVEARRSGGAGGTLTP